MTTKYEDLQYLESEKKQPEFRNGLPSPRSLLQRLCSGSHLLLLALGLCLLLLVLVCVTGSQNAKLRRDLLTLRTDFSNFTSNTTGEVQGLKSKDANLQETAASLQAKVEEHQQELQAARSLNAKVVTLESKLEEQGKEAKADQSNVLQRVQRLVQELNSLTCHLTLLKSNGSQNSCCLPNWLEHRGSCYWFSSSKKSWLEARKSCQLENAHLVVINSWDEQNFVESHLSTSLIWMGLNDIDGEWKWEDGTDYKTNLKNWAESQPDNWEGHGQGGGEDCAQLRQDGKWNDNVCSNPYRWICEAEMSGPARRVAE
ncbi:C-type lectin domain family 10 member A-like [Choloepus didactylus]|uniref:C-type lectin domain family 10 member A-like n=1 Tax=Choloepus didactylus TaxID=27675 RepID=UPI00189F6739|nr:C-type lectin domain family 10 member A-like [Choloepus didactylus]XP_037665267.1 C-type lectin domain family 10 member A-like [Choloepus didactylus]